MSGSRDSVTSKYQLFDVVIVGAGAIGAATALELSRAGAAVGVLERGNEWGAGCSRGSAGLICPSHAGPFARRGEITQAVRWLLRPDSPFSIAPRPAIVPWLMRLAMATKQSTVEAVTELIRTLSDESLCLHERFSEQADTGFTRAGLLDVYQTTHGLEWGRRASETLALADLEPRVLSASATLAEEPALNADLAGSVLYPNEAHCDPLLYVRAAGAAAEVAGAQLLTRAEVYKIEKDGRCVSLRTAAGLVRTRAVVIATGAWSRDVARMVTGRIAVQAGKGYTVDLEAGERALPRRPFVLREARVAITPLSGRLRLAGTMELSGMNDQIDAVRVDAIRQSAGDALVSWRDATVGEVWSGLRPCTPDGLPIVGWLSQRPPVAVATGHAMLGLTLAPVTGKIVTEILDGRPRPEAALLSPTRFDARNGLGIRSPRWNVQL